MIDVTMENFEADVIAASQTTPVLVDFWADWCGPCKSLGPVLEKLETAYAGRFTLVKVNADSEQQLAGAFGVKSLPTCILLMGGRPVDGFMGALPEGKLSIRAIQFYTVAPPNLNVSLNGNQTSISWPAISTGWQLEETDNLSSTNHWIAVTNIPISANYENLVTNTLKNGPRFFRLKK